MQVSKTELIHHRLRKQCLENTHSVILSILENAKDSIGIDQHWYRIGDHEVPVDMIEDLESEDTDESDTI